MSQQKPILHVDGEECYLTINNYVDELAMCLSLTDAKTNEPYCVPTKNFGNYSSETSFVQKNTSFFDINNMGQATVDELMEQLGGQPYVRFGQPVSIHSGFCQYPLYEMDPEKLKYYDPEGYENYSQQWDKACVREQRILSAKLFGFDFDDEMEDTDEDTF